MTGSDVAIQTEALTRNFGALRALDGLSVTVPHGSIFGFLGPNGSGKTTTIRLLLGLLAPTAGAATVLGFDPRTQGEAVRAQTGALLEHPGLYERLSAWDNLEFFGRAWRMPEAARRERIRELLTHFGFWERRGERVGRWSRGMKQKLAVARALLHRPRLIFLDEPTAGLDPVAAAALNDDLLGLARRDGVTVFLTTHNLAEAEKLCDIVGVVRQGRLLALGTPAELRSLGGTVRVEITGRGLPPLLEGLRTRPDVREAALEHDRLRLDLAGDTSVAPLVRLLVEGGAEIEEVRKGHGTLEEAFLSLVEGDG